MLKELLIEKTPKYTEVLPFSGKRVTYRPFLVREEKNLMIARETTSFQNLMVTIRDVINSCVTGLPDDDCSNLPFCDLEYIFLKIREKSLGEIVDCVINCPITKENINTQLDLTKVQITNKKLNTKLKLDENISVVMEQPTLNTYLTLDKFEITEEEESVVKLLALCIKEIKSNDEVYYTKEVEQQEVIDFIEALTAKQFSILLNFLKEIPTIQRKVEYKTKDGETRNVNLKGFSDFLELFLVMHL
jgi:hypothetical protein